MVLGYVNVMLKSHPHVHSLIHSLRPDDSQRDVLLLPLTSETYNSLLAYICQCLKIATGLALINGSLFYDGTLSMRRPNQITPT